ncbi:hypothetical protein BDV98DRAFT_576517, partial [Pterulicium gracile]
ATSFFYACHRRPPPSAQQLSGKFPPFLLLNPSSLLTFLWLEHIFAHHFHDRLTQPRYPGHRCLWPCGVNDHRDRQPQPLLSRCLA